MATLVAKKLLKGAFSRRNRDGSDYVFGVLFKTFQRSLQIQTSDLTKEDVDTILRRNERSTLIGNSNFEQILRVRFVFSAIFFLFHRRNS